MTLANPLKALDDREVAIKRATQKMIEKGLPYPTSAASASDLYDAVRLYSDRHAFLVRKYLNEANKTLSQSVNTNKAYKDFHA